MKCERLKVAKKRKKNSNRSRLDDKKVRTVFFVELKRTGQISAAAEAAGVSADVVYRRRKIDGRFRRDVKLCRDRFKSRLLEEIAGDEDWRAKAFVVTRMDDRENLQREKCDSRNEKLWPLVPQRPPAEVDPEYAKFARGLAREGEPSTAGE